MTGIDPIRFACAVLYAPAAYALAEGLLWAWSRTAKQQGGEPRRRDQQDNHSIHKRSQ